jgi:sporulation protein YlmC with PRC-barrel domain
MKRSILRALALCLTTAFAAGYAWAQDDTKTSGANSSTSSKSQTSGANSSTYSAGTSSSYSTRAGQSVRLSKLMNTSLKGQSGDSLGQVQDVIIDPTSGQAQFVVISLSPSSAGAPGTSSSTSSGIGTSTTTDSSVSSPRSANSGIGSYGTLTGGKLVAIPWRLMSQSSGDQFTVNVDSSKLQSAPTFSSSSWPTMDSAWMQRVYSHFGVDATSTGAPGSSSSTGTGTGTSNPSTPGLPSTPGTPDITPPAGANTTPGTTPGTSPATGTGAGTK